VALEVKWGSKLSNLTVSMMPQSGDLKDFDFDLSIQADNLGVSSNKIGFQGKGKINGANFTFSGLVSEFNIKFLLRKKYNEDYKYDAFVFRV
jgi:hypothetical protein